MFDFDEKYRIQRVRQGDTEAFTSLVSKYQSRVYNHIHGNIKNPETAKDLTQQTWLKAYRGIQGFRCESSFYSWVYRIAENVITDHFRRQKHIHAVDPLHLIDTSRITETHPSPCRDLERVELRAQLREAIAQLTPIRRRVFVLYYHFELPIKAIAARLNRSEGTIKTHLRNARLQLQELLTSDLQ